MLTHDSTVLITDFVLQIVPKDLFSLYEKYRLNSAPSRRPLGTSFSSQCRVFQNKNNNKKLLGQNHFIWKKCYFKTTTIELFSLPFCQWRNENKKTNLKNGVNQLYYLVSLQNCLQPVSYATKMFVAEMLCCGKGVCGKDATVTVPRSVD